MSRDTWYKCDPSDLLDAFVELADPNLIAMYAAIINRIYQSGGPISNSEVHLGSLAGLKPRKARNTIDQLIAIGKLYLVDGLLMQARCERELNRRSDLSQTRAAVGSTGGQARKNDPVSSQSRLDFDRKQNENEVKPERSREIHDPKMAENGQSAQAIASYARAREEREREETPLPPQSVRPIYVVPQPDFDKPIEPNERANIEHAPSLAVRREVAGLDVDLQSLTSRIMLEAKMISPPNDMPLLDGWVRLGADPEVDIIPTVIRLSAGARGPIRGFRYFDTEIRNIVATKKSLVDTQTEYFARVARRAAAK